MSYTDEDVVRQSIAYIRCSHGKPQGRPCGQCLKGVAVALRSIPADLVELTARALTRLDGFTSEPTALTRTYALELLQEIVPAIRSVRGVSDGG